MSVSSIVSRFRLRFAARGVLGLAAPMVGGPPARGAVLLWNTFGNGNFNDANNWFGGGPPGPSDFVKFELGWGPYTVTFPGNPLVNDGGFGGGGGAANYASSHLRVRDPALTFTGSTQPFVGSSTYTVTGTSQTEANRGIIIGETGGENASLSLSHSGFFGGGLSSLTGVAATLGDAVGAAGTLNVGAGAFNVTGSDFTQRQLIVGNHGSGTLNVINGADVNVLGSNSTVSLGHHAGGVGAVSISGAGSTMTTGNQLWIGENGAGTLTVQNGGSLVTSSTAGFSNIIGVFNGSSGAATITGPGSTWTNANTLRVGNSGSGSLTIANGGSFVQSNGFANIIIESRNGALAQVTGAGSSLTTAGAMYVGSTGDGAMAVLNGGSVSAGRLTLRGLNEGSGEVMVGGVGSTLNVTNVLEIGMPEGGFTTGPTKLTINPGAMVNVGQRIELDTNGLLKLQGGTLTAASIGSTDLLAGQYEGAFEWIAGTLHTGHVGGSVTNQGGVLAPGLSAGRTTIDGNYTQLAAAALEIEIGGTTPTTQHDFVYLEGAATLNGQLELGLINNFTPTAGQTFTILESISGMTGAFSNVANGQRLATEDGAGSFQVNYGAGSDFDPNQIVLSNFAADLAPADFDEDGDVDGDDLAKWKAGYGANGDHMAGDADGDNDVDGNDFLNWQRGLGNGAPSRPAVGAVPEPATLMLGCLAAIAVAASARRTSLSRS